MREGVEIDAVLGRGLGVRAGVGCDDGRLTEVGGGRRSVGELRREFTEHEVLAPLLDEPERGDVPEHGGAAVAEHDLPPVGQREERGEARADAADQVLHGRLPVRRPQHRRLGCHERVDLLGANLGRAAAETPVSR